MSNSTKMEMLERDSLPPKFSNFEFPKIDGLWLLSEIIFKVSKHFPIIILSFASLKLLLVVYDIYNNNFGFAILNSLFAVGDFVFLLQMHQKRKIYQKSSNLSQRIHSKSMDGLTE